MDHRTLGAAGPSVSLLGLGCNNFGGRIGFDATRAVVHQALDLGVTLFDTADNYGGGGTSEEFLGRVLGPRRKDVVIATPPEPEPASAPAPAPIPVEHG